MFGLILWLTFIFVGFFVIYYIIKIAVRNAISESLEDIREIISKTICNGRDEYDGRNDKE
ncbi:hypothetical protein LGL55_16705 [Clostridium tagluense]|uniref:hypothetical protein n=1 Tax=Clostridium tagluense TaxID=360422 RepID=UPI001CF0DB1C|nr:hypothetical protein [Clostridium tagluense]MCB2312941.1 hypothetical protein [Clostridium tagluense]MCB2317707.1 hypothetical protein [Clostridium tagluense]MCB2322458.1 hypothetical protein [Clostridium tagluense]MCB2327461.1 hypothetical protein [Clostridium tagluense]MCB2332180.1 hypothetical protein [Clostridium tagluense]